MNGTEEETIEPTETTETTEVPEVSEVFDQVSVPDEPTITTVVVEDTSVHFVLPPLQSNPDGWGPVGVPDQFKDMPYQPFSKSDRIGKVQLQYIFLILYQF